MHHNIELTGQCIKFVGHINIGFRWRAIVAGVVVYENERRGALFKRAFGNLARINRCVIHHAGIHQFVGDNVVFLVEKQHMKFFFVFPVPQCLFLLSRPECGGAYPIRPAIW